MLFAVVTLLMTARIAQSHPMPCLEDSQCPENFFCEVPIYTCSKCLDCEELNRSLLNKTSAGQCIKSDDRCGPCLEGFRQLRDAANCERGKEKILRFLTKEIYIWGTGAGALLGILISIMYIRVFQNIFKVVNCYISKPTTTHEDYKKMVGECAEVTKKSSLSREK